MFSLCGNIKENLGGNKIYECDNCLAIMDRDINGARNIYIKSIKN
jgi:transposase